MKNLKDCKLASVLLAAMLFVALPAANAQTVQKTSQTNGDTLIICLDDALKIALSENLTVRVADIEVEKSGYQRKGTYAALFPQIDFSANYQRTIKKQTMFFQGQSIAVGIDNTYAAGFSLAMPVINAPLWKSIAITADNVELAVEKARGSRQEMVAQIEEAFYAVLLSQDLYDVYKENYENASRDYEDIKQKYEFGTVAKYDMIMAEVNKQNAIPNMLDSKNAIEVCLWKLKALMGIDLNAPVKCAGSLYDFENQLTKPDLGQEISLERNSSLKQLNIQDEILYKTYRAKIAQFYPQLNLSLNYQRTAMAEDFRFNHYKWNPYSVGVLSLSIPIFTGGSRHYGVKEAKVTHDQMALQIEDTRRNLEVSVRSILSTLNTSIEQYKAASKSIEGAETGYEISQKRYDVGSGTFLELSDSQLALLQARLNLNQSIYNYISAKSKLDNVMGNNEDKIARLQSVSLDSNIEK